jgi:hypothetical protein
MNRLLVAHELLKAARELTGYKPLRVKRKPQQGDEKQKDQMYYRFNKRQIKKQQKKYRDRNEAALKRQRDKKRRQQA